MAKGGARNRSGPSFNPESTRSELRGISLNKLPSEGFDGAVPEFPIPPFEVLRKYKDDQGELVVEIDSEATDKFRSREIEVWLEAWRSPQATAWITEPWRWATIAEYCRIKVQVEQTLNATLTAQLHRFRDQIGLSPAGMKENGWQIGQSAQNDDDVKRGESSSSRDRFKVVGADGA